MDPQGKKKTLLSYLTRGVAMIHLDARRAGVLVPEKFANDAHLRLNLSYRYAIPDFHVSDERVQATLSFGGMPFQCSVPWEAIFGITSHATGDGQVWPEDLPTEVVRSLADKEDPLKSEARHTTPPGTQPQPNPQRKPRPSLVAVDGHGERDRDRRAPQDKDAAPQPQLQPAPEREPEARPHKARPQPQLQPAPEPQLQPAPQPQLQSAPQPPPATPQLQVEPQPADGQQRTEGQPGPRPDGEPPRRGHLRLVR